MRANEFITEGRRGLNNTNHIIYYLKNTKTGDIYVGVTLAGKDPDHSLKVRWQKHVRRAETEKRQWALCKAIRKYRPENFTYGILEKVKGKLNAHRREHELIKEMQPKLNSVCYTREDDSK